MAFERPTLATLIEQTESDIESRLTGGVPLLPVSLLRILARVFAGGLYLIYGFLDFLANSAILEDRAIGTWLDRLGVRWKVTRRAASFSSGSVTFTGIDDAVVPEGTRFLRNDGVEYETTEEGTIVSGECTVTVDCLTAGVIGDTPAGDELFSLSSPIVDIDGEIESLSTDGGADIEDAESYRDRIIARIQNTSMGGNEADYIAWAKEASTTVFKVFIFANEDYNGLGTVAVVIIENDVDDPDVEGSVITTVQDFIDLKKPVTAIVDVLTVTPTAIDFDIDITPNTSDIRDAIEAGIKDLFQDEGAPRGEIILSHISQIIASLGVVDHEISVPAANVQLTAFQYPILGTVTFGTL